MFPTLTEGTRMRRLIWAVMVTSALALSGVALAQEQRNQGSPRSEGHEQQQDHQQGSSKAPDAGPPGSLSNELSRSGGVIHPGPTGDQGVVAPPDKGAGTTPVIPPPGTPGGNPDLNPK